MNTGTYLNWLVENTKTKWWHDSADPAELQRGLDRGAVGVTTNPFLTERGAGQEPSRVGGGDRRRARDRESPAKPRPRR